LLPEENWNCIFLILKLRLIRRNTWIVSGE
jgi:hypothetical protein